jgi:hypothetical protein
MTGGSNQLVISVSTNTSHTLSSIYGSELIYKLTNTLINCWSCNSRKWLNVKDIERRRCGMLYDKKVILYYERSCTCSHPQRSIFPNRKLYTMSKGSQRISKTHNYQALSDHCTAMSGSTVDAVPPRHAAVCCYSVHTARVTFDPRTIMSLNKIMCLIFRVYIVRYY